MARPSNAQLSLLVLGAAALGALAWVLTGDGAGEAVRPEVPGPAGPAAPGSESAVVADTPLEEAPAPEARVAAAAPVGPALQLSEVDTKGTVTLEVLCLREGTREPLAGAVIEVRNDPDLPALAWGRTGPEGLWTLTSSFEDSGPGEERGRWPRSIEVRVLRGERTFARFETEGAIVRVELEQRLGVTAVGVVRTPGGAPVPGAALLLSLGPAPIDAYPVATTDAQGRFRVPGLTESDRLGASAPGFAPSIVQSVRGEPGAEFPLQLTLRPGAALVTGLVLDPRGAPVADAEVLVGIQDPGRVVLGDSREGRTPPPRSARTDAQGQFSLEDVALGLQPAAARAPGFGPAQTQVDVTLGTGTHVLLELTSERVVSGVVRTAGGELAPETEITWGSGFLSSRAESRSPDGTYELRGLPAGALPLQARHFEFGVAEVEVHLGGPVGRWDPVLTPEPRIFGVLVNPAREPLAGWSVSLEDPSGDGAFARRTTDASGRFSFEGVGTRTYDLTIDWHDRHKELPYGVVAGLRASEELVRITVRDEFPGTATVIGRVVVPNGGSPDIALVTGWHHTARYSGFEIMPEPDGTFEVARVAPGRIEFSIRSTRWPWVHLGPFDLGPGEVKDLGTIALEVGGHLRGRFAGLPPDIAAADVRLELTDVDWNGVGEITRTGAGFKSPPLASGTYHLHVDADFLESHRVEFTLGKAEERELVLEMRPAGVRRVRLHSAADLSAEWTQVRALDETGTERWTWDGRLPADGVVLRASLPPGSYTLVAEVTSGVRAETTLTISGFGEDALELDLELR